MENWGSKRCIIAGGRDFSDYDLMKTALDKIFEGSLPGLVISGAARGADTLGERYAAEYGVPVQQFPANWNLHGKSAGPIRNVEMAKRADALGVLGRSVERDEAHDRYCDKVEPESRNCQNLNCHPNRISNNS